MAGHIQNVAIVGASGRVGGAFAKALVQGGKHTVTALTRAGGSSNLPSGVKAVEVDYDDEASVVAALKGQQFLVITLSVRAPPGTHGKISAAAIKAGVPWIMPNSYGFDPINQNMAKDIPHGDSSKKYCDEILALGGKFIVLSCGFWYQWSLAIGQEWFGFDIKGRKVTFYDDGLQKINISTWEQCGRGLASLLLLPEKNTGKGPALEDWKDRAVYISSFRLSQRDMLDSLHRVLDTTDKDWTIEYEPTEKRNKDGWREYGEGKITGMAKAMYSRVFFPSGEGDVEPSKTANEILNLPKESLDDATREAVEMVNSGWNPFA